MSDNYWVSRAKGSDDATHIIREALEKSLCESRLHEFNEELKQLVSDDGYGQILESTPLELIPILLLASDSIETSPHPLKNTYELIARYGSPKEILLVVQESLDVLLQEAKELENEEESASSTPAQIVWKLLRLIEMSTLAFPRLVPRKRSAPETAIPIVQHIRNSLGILGTLIDPNEPVSREVVEACIGLGYSLLGWFDVVGSKADEVAECKMTLENLLRVAVAECLSDNQVMRDYNNFLHRVRIAGLDFTPIRFPEPSSKMTGSASRQLTGLSEALRHPRWRQTALGAINDCILGGLYEDQILEEDIATEIIPPARDDPFASQLLLEEYNPILLQSPVLEEKEAEGLKFVDTQEMNRLVEVLGFFYVLFARDGKNLTVVPLTKITCEQEPVLEDPSLYFAMRSISVSLERIEEIISRIES
ncbi:YAP/Alf4/glomulin family protein [Rhizoctonia solani]|uniref:YAP/Alf4/glomulin family protein n=1 Tax=Rhizoctonia solani TaxID=456999 RepID=A0A8H8P3Q0_9AGAM|nr:YAP/Alf4/glomulin family protein [Rhizoctonia solani]QRW23243.1 YAP/Alf4/glomulin family protein [Rhizoctonia solani]